MDGLEPTVRPITNVKESEEALKTLRWKFEALLGGTMEQVALEALNHAKRLLEENRSLQDEMHGLKERNTTLESQCQIHVCVLHCFLALKRRIGLVNVGNFSL